MSLARKFRRSKRVSSIGRTQACGQSNRDTAALDEKLRVATAIHEAAHAVVGTRLGFSLCQVEIRSRVHQRPNGDASLSSGCTTYFVPDLEQKFGEKDALRARAVFAAAGFVAERASENEDRTAVFDDFCGIRRFARALGMNDDPSDEQFVEFFTGVLNEATELLFVDGCVAWLRVAEALEENLTLSAQQVTTLVGP